MKQHMNRIILIDTRKRLIGLHGILVGCGEIIGKRYFSTRKMLRRINIKQSLKVVAYSDL